MVHALQFLQAVFHGAGEVVIGGNDGTVRVEFNHRRGSIHRVEDRTGLGVLYHVFGDVGSELDHRADLTIGIKHRVVRCFQPDRVAVLSETFELTRQYLTLSKPLPAGVVLVALVHLWLTEHPVVFALDFLKCVTDRIQKNIVGFNHSAIKIEFDDRHRAAYGIHNCLVVCMCWRRLGLV